MKTILLAVIVLAAPAFAGEMYMGAIVSAAGADTTNASTAAPFLIPEGSKLTLNCTAAANICVDTTTACTAVGGANPGVPVAASTNFPTSVDQIQRVKVTVATKTSSVVRIVGAGAVTCYLWARHGNE